MIEGEMLGTCFYLASRERCRGGVHRHPKTGNISGLTCGINDGKTIQWIDGQEFRDGPIVRMVEGVEAIPTHVARGESDRNSSRYKGFRCCAALDVTCPLRMCGKRGAQTVFGVPQTLEK